MQVLQSAENRDPSTLSVTERPTANADPTKVRIWADDVVIPTYLVGPPNRNPMFLENRVYQGSSGRVYPYPVIDRIFDERTDEAHRVVFLENRYLKLMVMPAFGGRIQYAYDKTNDYPFIYHNRVIKPALVGLTGPWLSGGIEFNWPQHHRPGTYCPVDYTITEGSDGSMTLWLSDIDPMWHLKGTLGLTLYPDKAFLEINVRLFNPTPLPQSFHLWTNAAVHASDSYQSIFPPDVHAVYDHGRRDVSAFPIARGEYYKVDYSRGVDISRYKNIPVPTSYMAVESHYAFLGGYDHNREAGVLHVADHHFVPGKKQWTWGCGDFGQAWDRNLTDDDGPYVELMCGVFADNQPDFAWLHPFEEKDVKQYFLPYKRIGRVVNASVHAAVSLEVEDDRARLGAYTTSSRPDSAIRLRRGDECLWERRVDLSPEAPLLADVPLSGAAIQELRLEVVSREGEMLVDYTPEAQQDSVPEPAAAIPEPREVATADALYLAGLHLEQYRHATREPEDYYREALRRHPGDVRSNSALGLLLMRRGQLADVEPFFRAAIEGQTRHNANPYDGEPYYNLGVCLRYLGRLDEAQAAFLKASWNAGWQDAAFFQASQLKALRHEWAKALELVERALARNAHNQKAAHLKALLLRRIGRTAEALETADAAIARDPLDFGARNERIALLANKKRAEEATREQAELLHLMRHEPHTHLEIAADYAHTGAYDDAIDLLNRVMSGTIAAQRAPGHTGAVGLPNSRPMLFYMCGYYASLQGDDSEARRYFTLASRQDTHCCFPNSLDSVLALETALKVNPGDARAAYYLGNLWYDKRQVREAITCWERSRKADSRFPTVHRNLALAYYNKRREPAKALRSIERAFALDRTDARVLFELDLLRKRVGVAPARRLALLRAHREQVEQRDDLLVEFVTLLNSFGAHEEGLRILTSRRFHPWEGGEGKVTGQYVVSLVELAKKRLTAGDPVQALELLGRARAYPANLGEGKLYGAQENHILYWMGIAHARQDRREAAETCWKNASVGMRAPAVAMYYNDPNPETIFYQGLALACLGRRPAAKERFQSLVRFGKEQEKKPVGIDYFAVSLPEFVVFDVDPTRRNQIDCRYLMALGYWGLGKHAESLRTLRLVLRLDPSHQPARLHLRTLTGRGVSE
jgi:tetratricopeptide (TPR) repeat protein